jgi:hypothetical protein
VKDMPSGILKKEGLLKIDPLNTARCRRSSDVSEWRVDARMQPLSDWKSSPYLA